MKPVSILEPVRDAGPHVSMRDEAGKKNDVASRSARDDGETVGHERASGDARVAAGRRRRARRDRQRHGCSSQKRLPFHFAPPPTL
ncbi:MAG: hypothetical protein DMF86_23370 [Acidobacteria bacterium]|nr:MAG: hypothetical protein DMF86_23370 [Acidobacteriota bacterium]